MLDYALLKEASNSRGGVVVSARASWAGGVRVRIRLQNSFFAFPAFAFFSFYVFILSFINSHLCLCLCYA